MDVIDVMRHMPGCRDYDTTPVSDDVLYRVLDNARFAPSGGNRQGWKVVVIRDEAHRVALRDQYRRTWDRYVAEMYGPPETHTDQVRSALSDAERMADELHTIPVHLAIWVDMAAIAVTDRSAPRPSVVAGGSIFPFIQNIQLAARHEGLGTRITTLLSYDEEPVRKMLRVPDGYALAAVLLVGWPRHLPKHLRRKPVEKFATFETFDGEPLRLASQ
jgi:nitroreductase